MSACRRFRAPAGRSRAGGDGAADLARADRIDHHAASAHPIQNRQIPARLLGVANHIEGCQIGDSLIDRALVVDVQRRAKFFCQVPYRKASDFGS